MQPAGFTQAQYAQMMQHQQQHYQYAQDQQQYQQSAVHGQQPYPGQPQQFARPGMPPMMGLPPHMQPQQTQQLAAMYAAQQAQAQQQQQGQGQGQQGFATPQPQRQAMRPPGMSSNPTPQQILFAQQQQQAQMAGGGGGMMQAPMGSPGMGMGMGMGMSMSPQARLMGGLPKQGATPVSAAGKKRGPKPKTQQHPMHHAQQGMPHAAMLAQSMPPPQSGLPPYVKPPAAIDEEPLADELDTVTARDLAATRYRRRHELMNEILGPATIAHLGAPPAPYADVDAEAMERQVLELESGNERLAKEMEQKLRETKERFEALGRGVAV